MPMLGASPHSHDAITNSSTLIVNRRTWPKRCVSQPVSGTEIAFATANEVMTQVPWDGLTPRSPEIAGIETFAIEVSSTFMKVASDSATVPSTSWLPVSGGNATGFAGGAGGVAGRSPAPAGSAAVVEDMLRRSGGSLQRGGGRRGVRAGDRRDRGLADRGGDRRGLARLRDGDIGRADLGVELAADPATIGGDDLAHLGVGRAVVV